MDTKSNVINEHSGQRFIVEELISKGMFGHVYMVFDTYDQKHYALKVILKSSSIIYEPSLLRELTILKKFPKSRHLLQMIDYHETDIYCCIKMPLMDCSLDHVMSRRRITVENMQLIISHIIVGLHDLHSNGYTHADVKPQNILIGHRLNRKEKFAVLCDFNWTMKLNDTFKIPYQLQSLPYRAPEVLFGDQYYDKKIDLWSVGIIMMEIITGTFFFNRPKDIPTNECNEAKVAQAYQIRSVFGEIPSDVINDCKANKRCWKQYSFLTQHVYAKITEHREIIRDAIKMKDRTNFTTPNTKPAIKHTIADWKEQAEPVKHTIADWKERAEPVKHSIAWKERAEPAKRGWEKPKDSKHAYPNTKDRQGRRSMRDIVLSIVDRDGDAINAEFARECVKNNNMMDFVERLTQLNPTNRMTTTDALHHPFLREVLVDASSE